MKSDLSFSIMRAARIRASRREWPMSDSKYLGLIRMMSMIFRMIKSFSSLSF